jgi:hypothetical protein
MCREKWKAQRFAMECKIRGLGCAINDPPGGRDDERFLFLLFEYAKRERR